MMLLNSISIFQLQFSDQYGILIQTLYLLFFMVLIFFGQKIQFHISLLEVGGIIKQLSIMKEAAKKDTLIEIKKHSENINIEFEMDRLLNSFMILPESMDPVGIVKKVEHIVDLRENRFLEDVRKLITKKDLEEYRIRNLSNMIEATLALNLLYKILEHYYLLAKKTGNYFLVAQLQMLAPLAFNEAKAYLYAVNAFKLGTPVGDSVGPLTIHSLLNNNDSKIIEVKKEYVKDTDVYIINRKGRILYLVKASGPGGNVGKPGEAIKKIIVGLKRKKKSIKNVIMIDAALKLEGEKTGSVAEGIGAAIGGFGVEKFKIEEEVTKYNIPIIAIIIKESFNEAISTMKKEIADAVLDVVKRIDRIINEETSENDIVIIAGIGNSIGVP